MLTHDEKTYGMLCHLITLSGFVFPLGNLIGPLIVWLLRKEQSHFVNDQGKESLNFQLSILIYIIITGVLMFLLIFLSLDLAGELASLAVLIIGCLFLIALCLLGIIMPIVASVRASSGVYYRYPLTLRMIQ